MLYVIDMKRSVLDFLYTDKFIKLLVSSKVFNTLYKRTSIISIAKESFDETVLNSFNDDLGIPDKIICCYPKKGIDDKDGEFYCKSITLTWVSKNPKKNIVEYDRIDDPAEIIIKNFRLKSEDGNTKIFINTWEMNWWEKGVCARNGGPCKIEGGETRCTINANDEIIDVLKPNFRTTWRYPDTNKQIYRYDIIKVIKTNDIEINELGRGGDVFNDALDKIAFISNI